MIIIETIVMCLESILNNIDLFVVIIGKKIDLQKTTIRVIFIIIGSKIRYF